MAHGVQLLSRRSAGRRATGSMIPMLAFADADNHRQVLSKRLARTASHTSKPRSFEHSLHYNVSVSMIQNPLDKVPVAESHLTIFDTRTVIGRITGGSS